MSTLDDLERRLRDRSEHHLLRAAMRELGSGAPGTVAPYRRRGERLWRWLFVPLYRRVPWHVKQRDDDLADDLARLDAAAAHSRRALAPALAGGVRLVSAG